MKIFDLNNVSFTYYGESPALNKVSLEIFSGEKLSILGSNGSGKTTLLSVLNGLLFPQRGEIRFLDQIITEKKLEDNKFNSFFRQKVGYVFQNPDVQLFCPTVADELNFGLQQLNLSKTELKERIDNAIATFNLEKLIDRAVFNLSFGEKKRVTLASVFILDPDVILLDEPTTGLDPKNKNILINLINMLNFEGKTVITTTHDLKIAEKISDKAVLFDETNTIIAYSDTKNIINNNEILSGAGLV